MSESKSTAYDDLKSLLDAGYSVVLDRVSDRYQLTVYNSGRRNYLNHRHYVDSSLPGAIAKAYGQECEEPEE